MAATVVWLLLLVSVVGIVYAAAFGIFFFVGHVALVAHVRGSAVKLGPRQFPELHAAVERVAARIGLDDVPDTYLMQAGGALNAFATKLFGGHLVVLYSDLLDACGDNTAARDMIIAHELGHVRAGHLRWQWFLLPSFFVPFLGTALSRAREYTCDRYGLVGAGDPAGAQLGLKILAAGATHGPRVDTRAMLDQAEDLNTGWMTIGEWLSTHPPLLKRIAALDSTLKPGGLPVAEGRARATLIAAAFLTPVFAVMWVGFRQMPKFIENVRQQAELQRQTGGGPPVIMVRPTDQARRDMQSLDAFLSAEVEAGSGLPADVDELYARWARYHPGQAVPLDPFNSQRYEYHTDERSAVLVSVGLDGRPGTRDDIVHPWRPPGAR